MSDLDAILGAGRESASQPIEENKEVAPVEAQEPTQDAETLPDESSEAPSTVPVSALQAERQKAKTYKEQVADFEKRLNEQNQAWEQRLQQLVSAIQPQQPQQPAPQAPEFWEAPEQAIDYRLNQTVAPLAGQLMQMREDFSKMQAIDKHGQDSVDAAFMEIANRMRSDPASVQGDYQRIMSSPHPYGSLVEWHKRQQVMSEIGSDPAAYKEKLKAELLAELQASRPSAQAGGVMPSNFATARNVGSRSGPAWSGPSPIENIFKR